METLDLSKYQKFQDSQLIIEFEPPTSIEQLFPKIKKELTSEFSESSEEIERGRRYFLNSTSSKLLLLPNRFALNTREYFGNFRDDYNLCHEYLSNKARLIFKVAKSTIGSPVRFLAAITKIYISFNGLKIQKSPEDFIADKFLKDQKENVEHLKINWGLRKKDKYFISTTISNFITRAVEKPTSGDAKEISVKLHELREVDKGLELIVDVNTKLDAFRKLPDYNDRDLEEFLRIVYEAVMERTPEFIK